MEKELEAAIRGDRKAFFDRLARASRLPGTKPNLELAKEVGDLMQGKNALALATRMTALHADEAPGGTSLEFLPVVGVYALGAIATAQDDRARDATFTTLHDASEDLRFRVRDAVPEAIARIGARHPDWTLRNLASWMDGFFHAAAVLRALANAEFLHAIREPGDLVLRIEEGFATLEDAPRAAARYPGFKALVDAFAVGVPKMAARFPAPVLDLLEKLAATKDPVLRDLIGQVARACKDADRVFSALEKTEPPRRDPRTDVGPTRRRGKR